MAKGPDTGNEAEDRSESPMGVGTPGGPKGGAWGKPDSHGITGSPPATPNKGKKPW